VVLVRPRHPENIGFVARAVANHGLGRLILVSPVAFDPERARWAAPGAHWVIDSALIVSTVSAGVANFEQVVATTARDRRIAQACWSPHQLCQELQRQPRKTAVLFGPEDTGLQTEELTLCRALIRIPTTEHSSLNLAQAVTALATLIRHASTAPPEEVPARNPLPVLAVQERLLDDAMELLEWSGYLHGRSEPRVRTTLFQLLSRVQEDGSEAGLLRGMLKGLRYQAGLVNETD